MKRSKQSGLFHCWAVLKTNFFTGAGMISRNRILLFLKGMAMGAADSVPGVSGGTIALITNIYEELIDAIKAVGPGVLQTWHKEGFGAAWREINGSFLLTLLLGILSALLLLGRVILGRHGFIPAIFTGLFFRPGPGIHLLRDQAGKVMDLFRLVPVHGRNCPGDSTSHLAAGRFE